MDHSSMVVWVTDVSPDFLLGVFSGELAVCFQGCIQYIFTSPCSTNFNPKPAAILQCRDFS